MLNRIYTFKGDATGAQGVLSFGAPIKMSEIFGGTNVFYVGQSFVIQEVLKIISQVDDTTLLRREDRWFDPKLYIGTWQRLNSTGLPTHNNTDYGLIRSTIIELSRYNTYTIGANPDKPIQLGDGGVIRQCNFELESVLLPLPGGTGVVAGSKPLDTDALFVYQNYFQPAAIDDAIYDLHFAGMGLYFYPGCSGIALTLDVSVVNVLYNGAEQWTAPLCKLGKQTCAEEFAAFVLLNNQGHPIDTIYPGSGLSGLYSSQGACDADVGAPCGQEIFTCTDGGVETYYRHINN